MKREAKILLDDIASSIVLIRKYTEGMTREEFQDDIKTQDAVTRRFEIIGEAAKGVPKDFKDLHPEVPWKLIVGLRDILIHGYFTVNPGRVWLVAKADLPELERQVIRILEDLNL